MRRPTIREPARDIPVFRTCDVLVVGGGPAGTAAAASAAQLGADTMLVERYGHLGGMSTGGFVLWIDRMTDWQGRQVIAGVANDLLDRLPRGRGARPAPGAVGVAGCGRGGVLEGSLQRLPGHGDVVTHGRPRDAQDGVAGSGPGARASPCCSTPGWWRRSRRATRSGA